MQNTAIAQTLREPSKPAFSRRFLSYSRDDSIRGRSLALANYLEQLKKQDSAREFQAELQNVIMVIREKGRETDDSKREKVLQVLKEFPSTIEEIAEDAGISKKEVAVIIEKLIREKIIIEKQQPHFLADGTHFTAFYELRDTQS